MVFNSLLNEFEYLVGYLLRRVKQGLLLVVLPVKSEIKDADSLPEIAQLRACSVDDPSNFVSDNKLEILHAE
jgi:hypothetical protein